MRLNNQSRRPTGIGMMVDTAIAKNTLATGHGGTVGVGEARAIYKEYPLLRATVPLPFGADELYLELLPTYLLLAPHFVITPTNDALTNKVACSIAGIMGTHIVQFPPIDLGGEEDGSNDDEEDDDDERCVSAALDEYKTIDGETIMTVAIQCEKLSSILMLMRTHPVLIGTFDDDRTSMLQHLLSIPKSHLIVREIASALEKAPFEKSPTSLSAATTAVARLLAHDLMLNGSKGIELLQTHKYDPTPILKLMDMPFLKKIADVLGYTGDLASILQRIAANSIVSNISAFH